MNFSSVFHKKYKISGDNYTSESRTTLRFQIYYEEAAVKVTLLKTIIIFMYGNISLLYNVTLINTKKLSLSFRGVKLKAWAHTTPQ